MKGVQELLAGMASVLVVVPPPNVQAMTVRRLDSRRDTQLLRQDWEKIAGDLFNAVEKAEHELKTN